jgi:ketosteroid isomerase-like protein
MTMSDPNSKKILRENGKYVTIYAREADGSWKMIEDINNPDAPAVPVTFAE